MARRVLLVDLGSHHRRRTRRLLFWSGIALGATLVGAGALWIAARSPLFTVRDVRINGGKYVAPEDVRGFLDSHVAQGRLARFFGARNLLAWPDGFTGSELSALPAATAIAIEKSYLRRTATATVAERVRIGQWCFEKEGSGQCFWFDDSGTLFMPGYPAEGNLTPVLHDHSRAPLGLGQIVLPPRLMPNLLSIFEALQKINLSIREVRLEDLALEEVQVHTYDGPRLLFSLRLSAAAAPDAIQALEKIAPLADLEYVDFRVENKVYYK